MYLLLPVGESSMKAGGRETLPHCGTSHASLVSHCRSGVVEIEVSVTTLYTFYNIICDYDVNFNICVVFCQKQENIKEIYLYQGTSSMHMTISGMTGVCVNCVKKIIFR